MKKTAAESQRLLWEVYGEHAPSQDTCERWLLRGCRKETRKTFQKFKDMELQALLDVDIRKHKNNSPSNWTSVNKLFPIDHSCACAVSNLCSTNCSGAPSVVWNPHFVLVHLVLKVLDLVLTLVKNFSRKVPKLTPFFFFHFQTRTAATATRMTIKKHTSDHKTVTWYCSFPTTTVGKISLRIGIELVKIVPTHLRRFPRRQTGCRDLNRHTWNRVCKLKLIEKRVNEWHVEID